MTTTYASTIARTATSDTSFHTKQIGSDRRPHTAISTRHGDHGYQPLCRQPLSRCLSHSPSATISP